MKYIIPTIDVEAIRTLSRLGDYEKLILGRIGDYSFGVPKILEIFDTFRVKGTFFVDFAEKDHDPKLFHLLTELILGKNNDVQLHVHPQFMSDPNRPLLHQYNIIEQEHCLDESIKAFYHATSHYPKAFRAGGYGADNNTLKLLSKFGISVDSSYFPGHENCKISPLTPNVISKVDDIIEVPVTVFKNNIDYRLAGNVVKQGSLIKKLDIDSCSLEELKLGLDAVSDSKIKIIILFMHSYSLIKWNPTYTKYEPDFADMEKLDSFLGYALGKDYTFATMDEIMNFLPVETGREYTIPEIKTERNFLNSVKRSISAKVRTTLRGK
ncbi:MAG: hypothetical protein P9L91_02300 [Candidatus Zophobacter franzmannii]|nr:hypothetical protein [Candidatus Zophobacter franzmannii]